MSASPRRRRSATRRGVVALVVGLLAAIGLTTIGATTLADSRAGRDIAARTIEQAALPDTATALVGVADSAGRLVGLVAMVLAPEGEGGSIVVIPPSANSTFDAEVTPLDETWAMQGGQAFLDEVEAMLGITFDIAEVVDEQRLAALLAPVGNVEVIVPEASAGALGAAPGTLRVLGPDQIAADLARVGDGDLDTYRETVWQAIGSAGSGRGSSVGDPAIAPDNLDTFLSRLFSGAVGVRGLRSGVPAPEMNPRALDTVELDRAELVLVFAQIAPARLAAPNYSFSFRIESLFSEEQLAPYGMNNADIARELVEVLLFVQANVISVATGGEGAPQRTVVAIAEEDLLDTIDEGWADLFGEIEVVPAAVEIARVDATIVLGTDYLQYRQQRLDGAD